MVRLFRPLLRRAGRDAGIGSYEGHRARGVQISTSLRGV